MKTVLRVMLLLAAGSIILTCAVAGAEEKMPEPVPVAVTAVPESPALPTEFTVFYDSDPPGAALYEMGSDVKVGETPFWATYRLTEKDRSQGWTAVDPCRVVWPSGATTANHPGLVFQLNKSLEQKYVFKRPDVPGQEADYEIGLKRLMQRYSGS